MCVSRRALVLGFLRTDSDAQVDARVVFIQPRVRPVAERASPHRFLCVSDASLVTSYRTLEYILREVMTLRRKQLANAIEYASERFCAPSPRQQLIHLRRLGEGAQELIEMAGLKASARPEDVTVAEWCVCVQCMLIGVLIVAAQGAVSQCVRQVAEAQHSRRLSAQGGDTARLHHEGAQVAAHGRRHPTEPEEGRGRRDRGDCRERCVPPR